ncbi:MAG: hypothetical protein NFW04_01335 [Candidatus Accumulibacter sp.]|uniref:hypothetical protein n=1 Tax=Accumulibacter sp. TaxID=2053492 RepID=UPI0026004AC9|nr:hypothetical protein [Accumulibacter sp.]MCM8597293.1 hypothetical protein [Accumulibacter sp.]
MNVVVFINSREAIPVRALPLVAPVPYGVRDLVEGLMCCDRDNAMHGLAAYQWSPGVKQPAEVLPVQWQRVHIRLLGLAASIKREESAERVSPDEGLDRWSRESINILPAGVFVWKDDFEDARKRRLRRVPEDEITALDNSRRDHIKFLQQQLELPANDPAVDQWECAVGENWREQLADYIAEERAVDPVRPESIVFYERICCGRAPLTDVSYTPLVDPGLYKLVMEGFESLLTVEIPDRTSTVKRRERLGSVSSAPAADLPQSVIDAMTVGYKDVEKLCNLDDEDDFGGYVVKKTGFYVKNHKKHHKQAWSLLTPGEKAALAWHPTGEYDEPALSLPCSFGELCAFLEEAGLNGAIDQFAVPEWLKEAAQSALAKTRTTGESTEGVSFEDRDIRAKTPEDRNANDATKDRFTERAFKFGFDMVVRERNGEHNCMAKCASANLTDERCIQLAHSHELRIADWTALTGVGCGELPSYLITAKGVAFRNWTEREIREASVDQQIDMHRDNEAEPLRFPCTPGMIIQFIDAAPPGSHRFSIPDVFRQAVTNTPVPAEQPALSDSGQPGAPTLVSDGEGEQVALSPTTTAQEQPKSGEPREVLLKRQAFIDTFQRIWPTIGGDLRDAARNGLSEVAKHRKHGFWCVEPALNWAKQRGKIQRDEADAFVRAEGESELSALVRALLDRK